LADSDCKLHPDFKRFQYVKNSGVKRIKIVYFWLGIEF
jgi:hypothetical protein